MVVEAPPYFTTSTVPTGNRFWNSSWCPLPQLTPRTLTISFREGFSVPWIVGGATADENDASQALLQMSDGSLERWFLDTNDSELIQYDAEALTSTDSPDRPSVARWAVSEDDGGDEDTFLAVVSLLSSSSLSPPSLYSAAIPISHSEDDSMMYVTSDQELRQARAGMDVTSPSLTEKVQAVLIDAHIVYSSKNRQWAVYAGATSRRYVHDIAGDAEEGYLVHILGLSAEDEGVVEWKFTISLDDDDPSTNTAVYEGLSPMWADLNQDGVDDLITTVSDFRIGSKLRAYIWNSDSQGVRFVADGPPIGTGFRWQHQLAVFASFQEVEIVEIRTPHIGGIVRYYRLNVAAQSLEIVADSLQLGRRFTSHDIDSRNLDQAVSGDFNGDGIPELVVATQSGSGVVGLQRVDDDGLVVAWEVSFPTGTRGGLRSNMAVTCSESQVSILLATANRVWRLQFTAEKTPLKPCRDKKRKEFVLASKKKRRVKKPCRWLTRRPTIAKEVECQAGTDACDRRCRETCLQLTGQCC